MPANNAINPMVCPGPEMLAKLLRDELDPTEVGSVEEHVGVCPSCQRVLDGLVGSLPDALSPVGRQEADAVEDPPALPGHEVLGRIDAGGMGVVWRVRDLAFGRDLAVKVMASRGRLSRWRIERFMSEARICAQLTHPFIVPVHGMGRLPDGRPYYTMKLVEGRTLAALLEAGPASAERRMELVQIFDKVCQAVAFAHGRGVIHRDLKPENVMVGAHGEVQLMDWGLAKSLAQPGAESLFGAETESSEGEPSTRTRAGSVLGTAAYMAPEQARGCIEEVDRQSDVFGLGGILCRLLSGQPPYTGASVEAIRRRAAAADLEEALTRLRGCGADPELVQLAERCLARRKADRPADAGEVATRLSAYQAGVQERLRRAELERAAAQASASAERTARRRTRALAVAVLALVTLAAGSGLWMQHQAAERQAEHARQENVFRQEVAADLDQALRFRQAGHFDASRELLEQDRQRLDDGGPDDLRAQVERCLADTTLARRLDDARQQSFGWEERGVDLVGTERLYATALAEAGLGREGDDPAEVGERVRASAVRAELVAALDNWAGVTWDDARRAWLLAVVRTADPDPERDRLRQPELWHDPDALTRLVRRPEAAHLPPDLTIALVRALFRGRRDASAVPLLRAAQAQRPDDFWLNAVLADELNRRGHPDEAIAFYRAALALRPESVASHRGIAIALCTRGQLEEAIGHYQEALRLRPGDISALLNLGDALTRKGQLEEAVRPFEKAVRLKPGEAVLHRTLAAALARSGQSDAAIHHYEESLRLNPRNPATHIGLGILLYNRGGREEGVRHYEEALRLRPNNSEAHYHLGEALRDRGEVDAAMRHYKEAYRFDPKHVAARYRLGNIFLDRGDVAAAVRHFEDALRIDPKHAEAHCQLGHSLLRQCLFHDALSHFVAGHKLGSKQPGWTYPSGQWVQHAYNLQLRDQKLSAILWGEAKSADAVEQLDLAEVCVMRKRYAAAARFAADAFAARPQLAEDLQAGHRYRAVRAAALAGCGRGRDTILLSDREKARLRRQARDWLGAGLARRTRQLSRDRRAAESALQHWMKDPELAGVRDLKALAQLPEGERQDWLDLWQKVERLLASASK